MSLFQTSRGPLLILLLIIILVYALRSFLSVPSSGSRFYRIGTRKQVSFLSLNIWLSNNTLRERMEALGQIVQDLEPDILAFQEVTLQNFALLRNQPWFSRYHLVPPDVSTVSKQVNHFVLLLSVFPVDKWFAHTFKKAPYKNRKIVTAEINNAVASHRFVVGVTHLVYARYDTLLRELQLKETLQVLSGYDNVCAMGDMNIYSGGDKVDGIVVLPSSWTDAWLSLPGNTDSNGYTFDQSKNPFSALHRRGNDPFVKERLDRVFCKLSDFRVKEMRIVGDTFSKSKVLPSDHYGLYTVIEQSENIEYKHERKSQPEKEVYFNRPAGWKKLAEQGRKSN